MFVFRSFAINALIDHKLGKTGVPGEKPLQGGVKGVVFPLRQEGIPFTVTLTVFRLNYLSLFLRIWCICGVFFVLQFDRLKLAQGAFYLH